MKKTILCLITCLAGLPLCGAIGDSAYFRYGFARVVPALDETAQIKAAVTEFNNRLMDIYASEANKKAVFQIPATTAMRHRLVADAGFIGMGGRVLIWDIASLEVKSVKVESPGAATVIANEEWNYQYKSDRNYRNVADVHGTGGLYRYVVVKKGGKWLVHKYEPVREGKKGA